MVSETVTVNRAALLHLLNGTREQQDEAAGKLRAALDGRSTKGSSNDGAWRFMDLDDEQIESDPIGGAE